MRPKDWTGAPGWLQDRLKEIEARRKPKIDWRRTLRIFANNASRTKLKGTMKRFSNVMVHLTLVYASNDFKKLLPLWTHLDPW